MSILLVIAESICYSLATQILLHWKIVVLSRSKTVAVITSVTVGAFPIVKNFLAYSSNNKEGQFSLTHALLNLSSDK